MNKALGTISFVGACIFVACLPGDLRPEPGQVYVSVQGSDTAVNGFVTGDGWTIQFEKLLLSMGYTVLAGEDCEVYGDARYNVLFDLTVPGKQKLGDVYGLAACNLQFHVSSLYWPGYLGNGVTLEDRGLVWDRNDLVAHSYFGATIYIRGSARRESVTKHFAWRFRPTYAFTKCKNPADGTSNTSLNLIGGEKIFPLVTFHPEELFRDGVGTDAKIRFDPLAEADINADDEVSLEEVSQIPAPLVELTGEELRDAGAPDGGYLLEDKSTLPGWARFMDQRLLENAFRLDGRVCQSHLIESERYKAENPYDL